MGQWICKNGHLFEWKRHGDLTKPERCPECGAVEVDAREV